MKAPRARWALAVLALLVLAFGAWLLFDSRIPAALPQDAEAWQTTQEGLAPGGTPAPRRAALPPMPPASTEFLVALPDLQARADAGDRRAACRLGFQLLRCQYARHLNFAAMPGEDGKDLEAGFERTGQLAAANQMAEIKIWHLESEQGCRLVPDTLKERGALYLRAAARAGDADAMLLYGQGQHLNPTGRGIAANPDFDNWVQEAPGMMHRALRAGNPAAAFALFAGHSGNYGFPDAFVPVDPYKAAVYHLLSTRLFGMQERVALLSQLEPEAQEAARAEAGRLHAELFDDRRFHSNRAMIVSPYLRPSEGQIEPCGDEE